LPRLVYLGVATALLVLLGGTIASACYDVPRPDCGFRCGPVGECPDGYTCASEQVCHRMGAPAGLTCSSPDAAVPDDAMIDTPDGPPQIDAAPDAEPDADIDAP